MSSPTARHSLHIASCRHIPLIRASSAGQEQAPITSDSTHMCSVLLPRCALTSYIRSVIDEQISRNHCLIPCQNNLLQKLRAKVLLHPGILQGKGSDEYGQPWHLHKWFSSGKDAAGAQAFLHVGRFWHHMKCKGQAYAFGRAQTALLQRCLGIILMEQEMSRLCHC